ncbi:MAG: DUF222 domain-containing protein [Kofleriaceae bacterium]
MDKHDLELLGEHIAEMAAHLDAATHRLLTDLRTFDGAGGWYTQGFPSCAKWLSWRVGWTNGTSREHVRVAQALKALPAIDDALRRGEVSYSKVRAMTRVATPANEAVLLEDARLATGAQLETICRKYQAVLQQGEPRSARNDRKCRHVTRRDLANGMVKIEATMHADEAALVWTAIEQAAREVCRDEQAAALGQPAGLTSTLEAASRVHEPACNHVDTSSDHIPDQPDGELADHRLSTNRIPDNRQEPLQASPCPAPAKPSFDRTAGLIAMAHQILRGRSRDRSPVELVVMLSADALAATPVSSTEAIGCCSDDTCLGSQAVRRLACDAGIVTMVENSGGEVVSVGRKTRAIPAPMKRALLHRDRTCTFPGCQNRVYLEGHHIEHWADGGETSLDNLICVCAYHHRFVHEYEYRIELTPGEDPKFYDRLGRLVLDVPEPVKPPALGWDAILAMNRALEITSGTAACGWDGDPVDYGAVIDDLVRADNLDNVSAETYLEYLGYSPRRRLASDDDAIDAAGN